MDMACPDLKLPEIWTRYMKGICVIAFREITPFQVGYLFE
jgi:hypothetical protein